MTDEAPEQLPSFAVKRPLPEMQGPMVIHSRIAIRLIHTAVIRFIHLRVFRNLEMQRLSLIIRSYL